MRPRFLSTISASRMPAMAIASSVGVAAFVALAIAGQAARAQTRSPSSPAPQANVNVSGSAGGSGASVAGGAGGAVDGQVGFSRSGQASPAEEIAQSDVILQRLQTASAAVSKQLGEARAAHDVVKVLCLNDKLSQMDVARRSAQDRKASLVSALAAKNDELAQHEFTILAVLKKRGDQLTADANQCIGEEAAFVGETQTLVTIDPNIPVGDETAYPPTDPTIVSGPPLPTSAEK